MVFYICQNCFKPILEHERFFFNKNHFCYYCFKGIVMKLNEETWPNKKESLWEKLLNNEATTNR